MLAVATCRSYAAGVFIKRNRSTTGDKQYRSVLLVHGERVPARRGPGRPRADEARRTTVVHRTLANLTKLPEELVNLIEAYCRGETWSVGSSERASPVVGRAYGPLAGLLGIARECGVDAALGDSRMGRLAMFLVLARVAHRGSRLSATRWAETQAVGEALGLGAFDEDDLYEALDWMCDRQAAIEKHLARGLKRSPSTVYLYDVTSSYLEGQRNELAAPGYNRDGKRFKKQIVVGLLTDGEGEPISVQVFEGNTADPKTVADQVRKLSEEFGAKDVALVGDRGMLKGPQRELLGEAGLRYVTALTDAQIRTRLASGVLQLELFAENVAEIAHDGVRHVLRRNPATTDRERYRRTDQIRAVQRKVDAHNERLAEKARASLETSIAQVQRWLGRYKLDAFVSVCAEGRRISLSVDEESKRKHEELDGCYVVVSDLPKEAADAECIWARYGDLQRVERDFRTMKTGLLELRPVFLRKANRTRAHAFVCMLALRIVRALERKVKPIGLTVRDALDRLDGVRLVTLADPALGLWSLPTRWDAPQRAVLSVLPPLPAPMLSPRQATVST